MFLTTKVLEEKPVLYRSAFMKIFKCPSAAIFLSQLYFWKPHARDSDGVYKTFTEWYDETGLSRRNIETARKTLKGFKVLVETKKGIPAKIYYKIDEGVLMGLLNDFYIQQSANEHSTTMAQPAKLEGMGEPFSDVLSVRSITENTPENTPENTKENISSSEAAPAGATTTAGDEVQALPPLPDFDLFFEREISPYLKPSFNSPNSFQRRACVSRINNAYKKFFGEGWGNSIAGNKRLLKSYENDLFNIYWLKTKKKVEKAVAKSNFLKVCNEVGFLHLMIALDDANRCYSRREKDYIPKGSNWLKHGKYEEFLPEMIDSEPDKELLKSNGVKKKTKLELSGKIFGRSCDF